MYKLIQDKTNIPTGDGHLGIGITWHTVQKEKAHLGTYTGVHSLNTRNSPEKAAVNYTAHCSFKIAPTWNANLFLLDDALRPPVKPSYIGTHFSPKLFFYKCLTHCQNITVCSPQTTFVKGGGGGHRQTIYT